MRNPNNVNTTVDESKKIIKIEEAPICGLEEFDIFDPKDFNKYILQIKREVRNSFEYRELISYLRNSIDMNACAVYEKVNNISTFAIKIEIHHHPFTLEDIVLTIFNKRSALGESLLVDDVAEEVMREHYLMIVGLIPLSKTVHELVHNGFYFIPMDKVFGCVNEYIEKYKQFMPPEQLELLEENISATESYNAEEYKKLLEVKHIGIEVKDHPLPELSEVMMLVRNAKDNYMK